MDPDTLDWPDLAQISISDAASHLSTVAEQAQARAVYLTRRGRPVAALVDPKVLARLVADAEELADIRASDRGADDLVGTTLTSWDEAKRALGAGA